MPRPGVLWMVTRPPCISTMDCTIESPSPEPAATTYRMGYRLHRVAGGWQVVDSIRLVR